MTDGRNKNIFVLYKKNQEQFCIAWQQELTMKPINTCRGYIYSRVLAWFEMLVF